MSLPSQSAPPAPHPLKTKKVWLAVLLNGFPLIMGLGYIYLGKGGRFLAVFLIQLLSLLPMTMLGMRDWNAYLLAIVWIISLIDVYGQAKDHNFRAGPRITPPS